MRLEIHWLALIMDVLISIVKTNPLVHLTSQGEASGRVSL